MNPQRRPGSCGAEDQKGGIWSLQQLRVKNKKFQFASEKKGQMKWTGVEWLFGTTGGFCCFKKSNMANFLCGGGEKEIKEILPVGRNYYRSKIP